MHCVDRHEQATLVPCPGSEVHCGRDASAAAANAFVSPVMDSVGVGILLGASEGTGVVEVVWVVGVFVVGVVVIGVVVIGVVGVVLIGVVEIVGVVVVGVVVVGVVGVAAEADAAHCASVLEAGST